MPFLEWKLFASGIKKENNFYPIINSSLWKKPLPSISPIITFEKLLCLPEHCFSLPIIPILPSPCWILYSPYWGFLLSSAQPLLSLCTCWVQSWEVQSTLGLTEMCRRQDNCGLRPQSWAWASFFSSTSLWTLQQGCSLVSLHCANKTEQICQLWCRSLSKRVTK